MTREEFADKNYAEDFFNLASAGLYNLLAVIKFQLYIFPAWSVWLPIPALKFTYSFSTLKYIWAVWGCLNIFLSPANFGHHQFCWSCCPMAAAAAAATRLLLLLAPQRPRRRCCCCCRQAERQGLLRPEKLK